MKVVSKRLQKELQEALKSPPPGVLAVATAANNLHEVHFVVSGPNETAYERGQYWGVFKFPPNYPAAPPELRFFTPSGRFEPGKPICASFTSFHPESWSVSWRLSSLLSATLSFMVESAPTAGSIDAMSFTRRELAAYSWTFNADSAQFRAMFPQLCDTARGRTLLQAHRESMRSQQLLLLVGLIAVLVLAIAYRVWSS
jgi:ubiquitin-conjugating enzyme E2 J2